MDSELCVKFSTQDWRSLSSRLQHGDEAAWIEAISVFERRIKERFLSCINALQSADSKHDLETSHSADADYCVPGFVIMAICCLLIETIQDFREEVPVDPLVQGQCTFPNGPCIRPESGTNKRFRSFLHSPAFGQAFSGGVARSFTSGIRNGILHNAKTRRWVIWREEPSGAIVAPEQNGFALNRTLFYKGVKKEFENYLQALRKPENSALRERFKQRMDRLCEES